MAETETEKAIAESFVILPVLPFHGWKVQSTNDAEGAQQKLDAILNETSIRTFIADFSAILTDHKNPNQLKNIKALLASDPMLSRAIVTLSRCNEASISFQQWLFTVLPLVSKSQRALSTKIIRACLRYDLRFFGFFDASVGTSPFGMALRIGLIELLNDLVQFDSNSVAECVRRSFVSIDKVPHSFLKCRAMEGPVNSKRKTAPYQIIFEQDCQSAGAEVFDDTTLAATKHERNMLKMTKFLLARKVVPYVIDATCTSALHLLVLPTSARWLRIQNLKLFLASEFCSMSTVNACNSTGETPLWKSIMEGDSLEVVRLLVQNGAQIYVASEAKKQTLITAVYEVLNGSSSIQTKDRVFKLLRTALDYNRSLMCQAQSAAVLGHKYTDDCAKSRILYLSKQFEVHEVAQGMQIADVQEMPNQFRSDEDKVIVDRRGIVYRLKIMEEPVASSVTADLLKLKVSGVKAHMRISLAPTNLGTSNFPVLWVVTTFPNAVHFDPNDPHYHGIGAHTFFVNVADYLAKMGLLNTELATIRLRQHLDICAGKTACAPQQDFDLGASAPTYMQHAGARVAAQVSGHEMTYFVPESRIRSKNPTHGLMHGSMSTADFVQHFSHDTSGYWIAMPSLTASHQLISMVRFLSDDDAHLPVEERKTERFMAEIPMVTLDVHFELRESYIHSCVLSTKIIERQKALKQKEEATKQKEPTGGSVVPIAQDDQKAAK